MTEAATAFDLGSQRRPTSLRTQLRDGTRDAHLAAEHAFDLPRRLATLDAYGEVLLAFESALRAAAPVLAAAAAWLPAELRDGPARRRARLDADLARLGRGPAAAPATDPVPCDPDFSLGAWYVHEGSALGGLVICAEIRRRLPAARRASSFFAGEAKGTAARWRAFEVRLGTWEGSGERVLEGAHASFAALTARLEDPA